jgi:hypothetical protein
MFKHLHQHLILHLLTRHHTSSSINTSQRLIAANTHITQL